MEETANSEAIRLAQASDWKGLQRLLERDPQVAKERGDHGMLPIHWACTVRRVPLSLVAKLLQAYPDGVRAKNAGQLLPLHIAIRARVHASVLRKLVRAYPDAVNECMPDDVSALQLAEQLALDADSLKVLYRAQDRSSLITQQQNDDYSSSMDRESESDQIKNALNNTQEEGEDSGANQIEEDEEKLQNWTSIPKPFVGNAVYGGYLHNSDEFDAQMSVLEPEDSISMLSERSLSDDEGLDSPHDHLVSPSSTSTCSQDGLRTPSSSRSSFALQLGAGIRALSGLQSENPDDSQRRLHRTVSLLGQLQSNGLLSERELKTMVSAMSESAATGIADDEAVSRSHNRHMSLPMMPSYENLRQNTNLHFYNEADDEEHDNASSRYSGSPVGQPDDNQSSTRARFFQSPKLRPQSRHSTTTGSHRGSPPLFRRSHRRASHGSHGRGRYESPPEWKHDDECSICRASFGMFKHRHHCRNCGKSICSQHSADKKLSMEAKGFTTPQRVCVTCYAMITHSRTLKHDLELEEIGREDSLLNSVAFQQQHYGLPAGGFGDSTTSAAVHPTLRSTAPPGGARGSPAVSPTTSTATAPHVTTRKSSLLAAGEATGGAGERATTTNHASGLAGSSSGSTSTVQELRCLLASQQKQIEQLAQSNMQMQQQLLEQEELKAETMLLITQLMTRVSVLELHKDTSRRSSKRRSAGTGDSEDDEEYPQDDTLAFER